MPLNKGSTVIRFRSVGLHLTLGYLEKFSKQCILVLSKEIAKIGYLPKHQYLETEKLVSEKHKLLANSHLKILNIRKFLAIQW